GDERSYAEVISAADAQSGGGGDHPAQHQRPTQPMAATEDDDYADYRNSLLVSPIKGPGGGGGGGRHYKRKRRHTKSFSASDEAGSAAAVGSGGVEAVDGGSEPTSTSEANMQTWSRPA
ncbi:uncharacterized protein LOC120349038, partial [Nilaparvata lugens]|uniref:uncharacterized protein LOC120349038 n=1 Tax=Nilaparvata lugens TaxID=108931 RepID=UPI00193D61DF